MDWLSGFQRQRQVLFLVLLAVAAGLSTVSIAQTTLDLDPPILKHTVPLQFSPGDPLQIVAIAQDDSGVENVTLFHRSTQSGVYESQSMDRKTGDEYSTVLETEKKATGINYYIEVVDIHGNRILEGSPDSPIALEVAKKSNMMYIVLGALAVGGLVALAGGGGDEGEPADNTNSTSTPSTRLLTITTAVPE